MHVFIKEFDTTVNITITSEDGLKNIREIEKRAKKHNLNLFKEERKPRKKRYEKQKNNIYLFLSDASWFEKTYKNIKIQKNEDHLNEFLKVEKNSLLTLNEINILPFSELDEKIFNGDYHIKGSPQDER